MVNSDLTVLAREIRRKIIEIIFEAGSGHPGGSLSAADIGTVLFFKILNHRPSEPSWSERDRFILSKGHAAPLLYVLLQKCGYFDEETLHTFRMFNSILQGHPSSIKCPGIEVGTGSLGQGLSIACGLALSAKLKNQDFHTFTLHGDGELQEGQIWEAAMFASHYKLNNLTAIIDRNRLQIDGNTEDVISLDYLDDKFSSFGWNVFIADGHDFDEINASLEQSKVQMRPSVVICNTIKGAGVSFMQNNAAWHGKAPNKDQFTKAIEELL